MDRESAKAKLKSWLLQDVGYLCRTNLSWSEPIVRTLRSIQETCAHAVFFGGTLRSLLLSRVKRGRLGRPRDVDIVVDGISVDALREKFREIISRETRFGGLQLERMEWQFDVWPLQRTWAFVQDNSTQPAFADLPSTTFFNLEAIAVDIWPIHGCARTVYSHNDQFFDGIITRTIEINREENPFPSLCVVRALIMASAMDFSIGPRLAFYLANHGSRIANDELHETQLKHYGKVWHDVRTMRQWLEHVKRSHDRDSDASVKLPISRQLTFWSEDEDGWPKLNFHVFTASRQRKTEGSSKTSSIE
jgi:hypothetical protein